MSDIIGGDVEIIARLMSAERLAVKRAHAARHPEGRTAELMAHIEAQAQTIREAWDIMRELYEGLDYWTYGMNTVYAEDLKNAEAWLTAHKEE